MVLDSTQLLLTLEAPEGYVSKAYRALMRFMNMSSETKYVMLSMVKRIATEYPHIVSPYHRSFWIITLEKNYCKLIKMEILSLIANSQNWSEISSELQVYMRSELEIVQKKSIESLGVIAEREKSLAVKAAQVLLTGMKSGKTVLETLCRVLAGEVDKYLPIIVFVMEAGHSLDTPQRLAVLSLLPLVAVIYSLFIILASTPHSLPITLLSLDSGPPFGLHCPQEQSPIFWLPPAL